MRVFLLATLLLTLAAPARAAGTTILFADLDELVRRQSLGLHANHLGPSLTGRDADWSVAVRPFLGGYGADGILSGVGVAVHSARSAPWNVGGGLALFDADFPTWIVSGSVDRRIRDGERLDVDVGGVLGYQFGPTGNGRYAIEREIDGVDRRLRIDSLVLGHAMARVVFTLDLWVLRPSLDLAWIGTAHRLAGSPFEDGLGREDFDADDRGVSSKGAVGFGVALDATSALVFGGFGVDGDDGYFELAIGARF